MRGPFDPLVELHGVWTTDLAERYLPIEGMPPAKYECVDGKLILTPYEAAPNSYAAMKLGHLVRNAVETAGLRLYGTINLRFTPQRWIQPDFAVVHTPADGVWVEATDVELVGELVSPSSRTRDRIDKPDICAAAGIPYYLAAEVSLRDKFAVARLQRLTSDGYQLVASAQVGELFEVSEPFAMSFDPVELLDL
ncbi:Uma2 family endonuclease [Actinocrispum wychmicini]|nr:Uma2 family endonuclease [Actinocrispum wychmicini]